MRNKPSYRHLLWALLLSLLAHMAMIGQLPRWLTEIEETGIPLEVELVQATTPEPVATRSPEVHKSKKLPPTPKPEQKSRAPEPLPIANPETPASPPAVEQPPTIVPTPVAEVPAPVAAAIPLIEESAPIQLPEEEPVAAPPRHVEIEYQLLHKGRVAGVERHSYKAGDDGSYILSSIAEPKGLLSLVVSDLVQKSEGVITERGLRPSTFLYQYGKKTDKAQKASFDWQSAKLVMESGTRRQIVELPDGAQDLMSFMYQFMFTPPLQEMQLVITNGKRLKTYDYGFDGEEILETKIGALRCIHIGRSSDDGEEKTELWLAADYHYLPVKFRKTEKDGTVLERIASRLQIE